MRSRTEEGLANLALTSTERLALWRVASSREYHGSSAGARLGSLMFPIQSLTCVSEQHSTGMSTEQADLHMLPSVGHAGKPYVYNRGNM